MKHYLTVQRKNSSVDFTFNSHEEMADYINTHWDDNADYWISNDMMPIAMEIRDVPWLI